MTSRLQALTMAAGMVGLMTPPACARPRAAHRGFALMQTLPKKHNQARFHDKRHGLAGPGRDLLVHHYRAD